ncbi:MAG: SulP family inorganic anion transporter [Rhodospirillales bacterium]|nr:SulP family inorganic anion transporter [Rhodospirillales bacterium]
MNLFSHLRGDIFGGMTAAVVALPLALAFGVASGAGPEAGLYGAIALGFFAALFGGTPTQISGPTGPMTVVMTGVLVTMQVHPGAAFAAVILGGLFQILFGYLKLGRYISYVPYPVISGFMSGIGLIIIILQLPVFLGYDGGGPVVDTLKGLTREFTAPYGHALAVGLIALLVAIFMPRRWRAFLPPPLAALIAATLAAYFLFTEAPTLNAVPAGLPSLMWPSLSGELLSSILGAALTLAMLGTIDSLLTSLVADNFTRTRHNPDRELVGQGIGNIAAGLIGGLPGAGATMRTVVNIRAGGRTPLSGMVHAVVLLAFVMGLGDLVQYIPRAALAGILLKVGWDIIDWSFLRRLVEAGFKGADRQAIAVMLTVMVLTVTVDLIMAVAVGIIMESLMTARRLATHQIDDVQFVAAGGKSDVRHNLTEGEQALLDQAGADLLLLRFTGPLSFGTARDLAARMEGLNEGYKAVVIDLTDARMMDISIMVTLADMIGELKDKGCRLYVGGMKNAIAPMLAAHGILKKIPTAKRFDTRRAALEKAVGDLS